MSQKKLNSRTGITKYNKKLIAIWLTVNRSLFRDVTSSGKCPITPQYKTQPIPLLCRQCSLHMMKDSLSRAGWGSQLPARPLAFSTESFLLLPPPFSSVLLPSSSSLPSLAQGLQTHLSASHLTASSHGLLTQFPPGSQGSLRSPV